MDLILLDLNCELCVERDIYSRNFDIFKTINYSATCYVNVVPFYVSLD